MNHIYRSVWNEITRTYVAAAEIVRGKGKGSKSSSSAEGSEATLEAGSNLTGSSSEQGPPGRPTGVRFSGFRSMALEQRFMFDGAAVSVALDSTDPATNNAAESAKLPVDFLQFATDLANAKHPYTRGLLGCLPQLGQSSHPLPVLDRQAEWSL